MKTPSAFDNSRLIDQLPLPLVATDLNLVIKTWNKAAEQYYGWSAQEAIGKVVIQLFQTKFHEDDTFDIQEILQTKGKYSGIVSHCHKSGAVNIDELNIMHIEDGSGNAIGYVALHRDITEEFAAKQNLITTLYENKKLSEALICLQTDIRKKISLELHDNLCQLIAASKLSLEYMHETDEKITTHHNHEIKTVIDNLVDAEYFIRGTTNFLYPVILDDLGISSAIYDLAQMMLRRYGFNIHLHGIPVLSAHINKADSIQVYWIVHELLMNVGKHAKASEVRIDVEILDNNVLVRVIDDGSGFDAAKPAVHDASRHFGLRILSARAEMIEATLQINSNINQGTTVELRVPIGGKINEEN